MSEPNNNIFTEFLDDYFAECEEHLTNVQQQLLALENYLNQEKIEANIVNQLFRSFHTIKGLSGMVGFQDIETLAHQMESYLRLLRDEQVMLEASGFECLINSTKLLEKLIIAQQNHTASPEIESTVNQLKKIIEEVSPTNTTSSAQVISQRLQLTPQQEENVIKLIESSQNHRAWHLSFQPHPHLAEKGINVNVIRSRLESLGTIIHSAPRLTSTNDIVFDFIFVSDVGQDTLIPWQEEGIIWDLYYEKMSQVSSSKIEEVEVEEDHIQVDSEVSPVTAKQLMSSGTEMVTPMQKLEPNTMEQSSPLKIIESSSVLNSSPLISQNTNVVRVDLGKLDDLMRLLGELVMSRAKLEENLKQIHTDLDASQRRSLQEINFTLERQMRDLREGIMRVRLVPIGEVFARMQFVVRDLVRSSHKEINLEIEGQNTEIDKLVVERMMDPLLHLVRNAVSHGIETKEERSKQGKPSVAQITLKAKTVGEMVLIEIEDDGKGIDQDQVLAKAQQKGLITKLEQEHLDNFTMLELLCQAGFSTQDQADRVSGRGVGMTVVKNTVTELGGVLELTTQKGQGTRFLIQLPLTLAIADALIVVVCGQRFAIPQSSIREIIEIPVRDLITLEKNEIITYRGQVLPVKRLAQVFNLTPTVKAEFYDFHTLSSLNHDYLNIVVIGTQTNAIGLVIDQVIGVREIVLRPLHDPLVKVIGIAGATELGDGRVVLILDSNALVRNASKVISY